jgi:AraC family transcriptional regulator
MTLSARGGKVSVDIVAQMDLPIAFLQIVHFEMFSPLEDTIRDDQVFRLDLGLSPRLANSRYRYSDRWQANRFEPAGELMVLPPGQALQMKSGVGQHDILLCDLPVRAVERWLDGKFEWTDRQLDASLNIASPAIRHLLLQLGQEARHPGFASKIMMEALAMQIAVNLQRYFLAVEDKPVAGGLLPWRLRLVDERLGDLNTVPSLHELAELCRLSVRQFSRAFRISRGLSIGEYVAERRLEKAKELLAAGGRVKAVSYATGFASPSSFCYAFRKAVGVAPGEYQLRVGGRR